MTLPTSLLVANYGSKNVTFLNPQGHPATVPVSFEPYGLAVDKQRHRVYVTDGDEVSIIDTASHKIVNRIRVGNQASLPALNAERTRLYVPNFRSDTLSVIDTIAEKVIQEIPVGSQPFQAVVDPHDTFVYVSNSGTFTISVVSTKAFRPGAPVPTPETINVSPNPYGLALDAAGRFLYVVSQYAQQVDVIDLEQQRQVVDHLPVGQSPCGIALGREPDQIWVTDNGSNTVSVLDLKTRKLLKTIPLDSPLEVAISGPYAFVGQFNDNQVAVFERKTLRQEGVAKVGLQPQAIAVA